MKIGTKDYKTGTRPDDLDAQLLGSTGCNAAEIAGQLAGTPLAGTAAAALKPFLPKDSPSVPEIAAAIGDDGYADALVEIRRLYVDPPAPSKAGASNG